MWVMWGAPECARHHETNAASMKRCNENRYLGSN
jgi:hypothetical protein